MNGIEHTPGDEGWQRKALTPFSKATILFIGYLSDLQGRYRFLNSCVFLPLSRYMYRSFLQSHEYLNYPATVSLSLI